VCQHVACMYAICTSVNGIYVYVACMYVIYTSVNGMYACIYVCIHIYVLYMYTYLHVRHDVYIYSNLHLFVAHASRA